LSAGELDRAAALADLEQPEQPKLHEAPNVSPWPRTCQEQGDLLARRPEKP
jgi:hypothetical protein